MTDRRLREHVGTIAATALAFLSAPSLAPAVVLASRSSWSRTHGYRTLCQQFLPQLERHQGMIEEYGRTVGAEGSGGLKGAIGSVLGKARDAVDAMRETDFLRVVGDIVMIRQAQDTFATFARAGEGLGEQRLAEIGRMGEEEHDRMQRQFNEYCAQLFVAHVQGTVPARDRSRVDSSTTARTTY